MDLTAKQDNAIGAGTVITAGAGLVGAAAKPFVGLAASIRNKAKAKKAQKISDAGGYLTLTAFQKSLIGVPSYIQTAGIPAEVAQEAEPIPATEGQVAAKFKTYLPYIIGAVVLIVIVFIIVKRK